MTEGPARLMVTLLPKNRPTPMAPPMAIMDSWRSVSLRCKCWDGWAVSGAFSPPGEALVIVILRLPPFAQPACPQPLHRESMGNGSITCDLLRLIRKPANVFLRGVGHHRHSYGPAIARMAASLHEPD